MNKLIPLLGGYTNVLESLDNSLAHDEVITSWGINEDIMNRYPQCVICTNNIFYDNGRVNILNWYHIPQTFPNVLPLLKLTITQLIWCWALYSLILLSTLFYYSPLLLYHFTSEIICIWFLWQHIDVVIGCQNYTNCTNKSVSKYPNYLEQVVCLTPFLQKYIQKNRQTNRPGPRCDPTHY